jgi:hypothetical protein
MGVRLPHWAPFSSLAITGFFFLKDNMKYILTLNWLIIFLGSSLGFIFSFQRPELPSLFGKILIISLFVLVGFFLNFRFRILFLRLLSCLLLFVCFFYSFKTNEISISIASSYNYSITGEWLGRDTAFEREVSRIKLVIELILAITALTSFLQLFTPSQILESFLKGKNKKWN